jgi:large subunit ribosomal protein L15
MNLANLSKITPKSKRRLGQGHGSGRGKTGGRGTKGQKARGHIKLNFEGGALPLTKRLPFLRGRSNNKSYQKKPIVINVGDLNIFSPKSAITKDALISKGLIKSKEASKEIKILGNGELKVALQVFLPVSKSAIGKIEKAGGTIEGKKE